MQRFSSAIAPHGLDVPGDEAGRAQDWADPFLLGLRDAHLNGWFDGAKRQVLPGFSIEPGDIVVDVGCGDGGTAGFCAEHGARVLLADNDAQRLARAASWVAKCGTLPPLAMLTNADPLPLTANCAERVMCMEVLEHVTDPVKLMAELVRIGKPRARYLITVPDPSQEHLQKHVARPAYFQEPYHLRIFERADFAALVTQAGLRIERRQYYGAFWSVWYLLFWQANAEDPVTASSHPLLQSWTRTWAALLESEGGLRAKQVLDRLLPKSQAIVAVKPE